MKLLENIKNKLATRREDMDIVDSRTESNCDLTGLTESMVFLELMKLAKEVFVEEEKTKRYEIWSQMEIRKAELKTELSKMYIGKVFEERKLALDSYYDIMKSAIEKGNDEMVIRSMAMIGNIVTTSPLKDIEKIMTSYLTGGQIEPIEL